MTKNRNRKKEIICEQTTESFYTFDVTLTLVLLDYDDIVHVYCIHMGSVYVYMIYIDNIIYKVNII